MVHLLVTGQVHVGKTTALRRAMADPRLARWRAGGFITTPLLSADNRRVGLVIEDVHGRARHQLARMDRALGGPTIGPYSFDPEVVRWGDQLVDQALHRGCDLVVVDEIGRLELELGLGFQRTLAALQRPITSPAVVVVRQALLPILVQRLSSVQAKVVLVTAANRERAPGQIVDALLGLESSLCATPQDGIMP